jgi:hypothetical protein
MRTSCSGSLLKDGAFHGNRTNLMREFRTSYSAPYRTGKPGRRGYVATRTYIAVRHSHTNKVKRCLTRCPMLRMSIEKVLHGVEHVHRFTRAVSVRSATRANFCKLRKKTRRWPRPANGSSRIASSAGITYTCCRFS